MKKGQGSHGFKRILDRAFGEDSSALVDVLKQLLGHKDAKVRLEAVRTALDYQIGKPTQRIDHSGIPQTVLPTIVIKTLAEPEIVLGAALELPTIDAESSELPALPEAIAEASAFTLPTIEVAPNEEDLAPMTPETPPPPVVVKRKRGRPPKRPSLGPRALA